MPKGNLLYLRQFLLRPLTSFQISSIEVFFSVFLPTTDTIFCKFWFDTFKNITGVFVRRKRRKRLYYPDYYSSHAIYLLNKKHTAERRHTDIHKMANLHKQCWESFELDKEVFTEGFVQRNPSMYSCYKLLQNLYENDLPSRMYLQNDSFNSDQEIANAVNVYFSSAYQKRPSCAEDFPGLILNDLKFS